MKPNSISAAMLKNPSVGMLAFHTDQVDDTIICKIIMAGHPDLAENTLTTCLLCCDRDRVKYKIPCAGRRGVISNEVTGHGSSLNTSPLFFSLNLTHVFLFSLYLYL